ncbi:vacuolar protein sorting-associated protein 54, chloroplastic-like isoform X1 [Cynara cardunculus var. scolymus]|uniref:vacuolar protein sorting-associated protein 54, chloroplastic-like isoform X1 n=1 Tax=Cynara cardunculus var. scolymus TaxID=59895 RepID=UPI000D627349|nr:vacuolar protein sorting-associated protein 54, chloroplastic-like isoform X1 [Cynara cardunculus var. scolymus]
MDPQPFPKSGRGIADRHNSSPSSLLAKTVSDASSQSLASILNNPHADSSWVGWWSSSAAVAVPEFAAPPATKPPGSEITRSHFTSYLLSIAEHHSRFEDIRNHSNKESRDEVDRDHDERAGEALVACLREVPALYFKEDFALEDGATFRAACPNSTVAENSVLQEKLSQYLDVVELYLVKEISLRSNSFFEAQGQLEDMNLKIVEGCKRIRELKETIRLLDVDLVDCARQIQDLNLTRSDLLALQQKLRLILYVNQSLAALKLLVASADCAGALDVTDDLKQFLDDDELTGLHCFRHLGDHVAGAVDSVNSILSAEFLRVSISDSGGMDKIILAKAKARASSTGNVEDNKVELHQEDASSFRDRLLPLIIGLLRTAKLPAVLRVYRDTVTSDMKTAIKSVVAELLPVLVARPLDSDFMPGERIVDNDGGGLSLASKLRSLSSDSFVLLLDTIFRIVQAHLLQAAEVKKSIEWIMSNLDGHYAADSVADAIAHGALSAETAQIDYGLADSFVTYSVKKNAIKVPTFQEKGNDATSPSNMSKNFRADVLRENTEAVFAACDAAHGRWAKLLGVRAALHPRLRVQDFLHIYNMSQEFITATEKIGGRLGYSIRGTLQSQAKAFVDFQHESRMTKLKAVLDQEKWVEVDVPYEYRAIVISAFCSESLISGDLDNYSNGLAKGYDEVVHNNNASSALIDDGVSLSSSQEQVMKLSSQHADVSDSTEQINGIKVKNEHGKPSSHLLSFRGVGYHMVNSGLILLKMLSEYIDMNTVFPTLSSEVIRCVLEMLKFFNTRTCQLVLGAGAMQVSGLKSITSKHLALASQVISFVHAIIPEIKRVLLVKVAETRKGLLLSEIERVLQDYKVHRDEIHTKLVQIMKERLLVHLRGLPQIVETWHRSDETDVQPSQFARNLTKEVGLLKRVLSRNLHEVDVQEIFREVTIAFDIQISDAFSRVDISTPQARARLACDIQHILGCIRSLPSANLSDSQDPVPAQLELLLQRVTAEADQ